VARDLLLQGRLLRVGRLESDGFDFPTDPAAFLEEARAARERIDVFTFVQTLPHAEPLFSYPKEIDNFAALPVSTFDHWWSKQIDNKTRNMARKGEKKGLVVREAAFDDDFVKGISGIYNESPIRQGKRFWHYHKSLEAVRRENGTFLSQAVFIGAFLKEELIGFIKLVIDKEGGQAGVMQILSMLKHRDKAPTNALIAQAVRSCADRHVPYITYAKLSYGHKQSDSLAVFKVSNGFQRLEVPRYYVPLTVRGKVAVALGFHHQLSEIIPEPVLVKFRELRELWYSRRFPQQVRGT